jgi:hypothetical protein
VCTRLGGREIVAAQAECNHDAGETFALDRLD